MSSSREHAVVTDQDLFSVVKAVPNDNYSIASYIIISNLHASKSTSI
jgi:hypothetical protein